MAYFEPYIDSEGVHVPTYDEVLEYLENQYRSIFGADVYLGPETPDYQMLSIVAKCLNDFSALATQAYYERNPQFASGDSLDLIVQLSGLTRRLPTASTAVLTIEGVEGTEIEAGSQAIDGNGYVWSIDEDVTIPAAGEIDVNATCDTEGAIIAPAGTINSIYTPVPGWVSVTNAEDAEVGVNMETDAELRTRFAASHTMTNSGVMSSLIAGLLNVSGVKFVDVVENNTGSTDANGLPAHSFCAVVEGGSDEEVASKILSLKSPGVATYGNTTEEVTDAEGTEYEISFSRPTETVVPIVVSVKDLGGYDASRIDGIIKNALMEDINALGIGKSWALTMGYKDIYSQFSDSMPIAVTNITSTAAVNGIVSCDFDHVLTADEEHITITEVE